MICKNRQEFMSTLREALTSYNVTDINDILDDFGRHFEDGYKAGETEEEVCVKLGDPEEIARQYAGEEELGRKRAAHIDPDKEKYENEAPEGGFKSAPDTGYAAGGGFTARIGDIIGLLCVDLFVLTWAIPTLGGLVTGLCGISVGMLLSGIATMISGSLSAVFDMSWIFESGLSSVSCVFLGIFLISVGGLLGIASLSAIRGFVNFIIGIINWHARALTGHNILNKWLPKKKGEQPA